MAKHLESLKEEARTVRVSKLNNAKKLGSLKNRPGHLESLKE